MAIPYTLYPILIILLSIGGFLIANYIRGHKRMGQTLVCPIGTTCDTVIHSDYSKFFGIPVEILGMFYYAVIAVFYTTLLVRPELAHPTIIFVVAGLTTAAFLFSLYLTFIQAFALRQWCTWCLISASFCTLILALVIMGSSEGLMELLAGHKRVFVGLHILGLAFGLGGATISDVLFFKFLKDLRISKAESDVLRVLSQVIWLGLALLILSGLGMYLPGMEGYNESAKFLVKMIIVAIIIINGSFLNLLISPNLVRISFGLSHDHMTGELHKLRRLAYAMGAISMVSWYSAFVLGILRSSPVSFSVLLGAYFTVLVFAIAMSQAVERYIGKKTMLPESAEVAE